ncbi:MAG: aminotransferase class I/II-fold pyridoxal phosphate-dependent enzyme [Polyangiaceae bacterium]|nr:aminotransferase class I/II-fold pyridoxal phosphate-dependent enzyme [Polyangiaceae bacterium]
MAAPRQPHRRADSTAAVHAGAPAERPHHALAPGVAQTATFTFRDTADLERYMRGEDADADREEYGRYGNPTVRELEHRVAALEGAEDAAAFASGMAAVTTTALALVKAGDHVVLFEDCYRRTRQFVRQHLARFGVEHTLVPPGDTTALAAALRPSTRLVLAETPTNPYLYCTDLEELSRVVRAHGRARTLVDSTFATPINLRPLELGVDLVVHSATKYLSGHNDVLAGVVAGAQHLISLVRDLRGVLGGVLDPHAAFLVSRGLKTLGVRVARQNEAALAVARALEGHPAIERVFYPLLESHPSHAVASRTLRGGGGVVSFIVRGGRAAASRFVDACRLATIAPSLGGVETLVEQPSLMSFFELSEEELSAIGIDPALIRLAVGVEETSDILADVLRALE